MMANATKDNICVLHSRDGEKNLAELKKFMMAKGINTKIYVLQPKLVVFKDEIANQSKISGWYNFCRDGESGGFVRSRSFGEASLEVDPVVHLVHSRCLRSALQGMLADLERTTC